MPRGADHPGRLAHIGRQLTGLAATARAGHGVARMEAIVDSRAVVRALFLASAVRAGLLDAIRGGATLSELSLRIGAVRTDRLAAWLEVGCALGELRRRGDRFEVRGRRSRAIADGDVLLAAHYRSVLDYQTGPYAELDALLRAGPGEGRDDLERFADDIARVSLAAAPVVSEVVRRVVRELRPARVLDVGCGTAVYSAVALTTDPDLVVTGIDLSAEVVDAARADLERAGLGDRIRLETGDIRVWAASTGERFDLVMAHNTIYYVPAAERAGLVADLASLLRDRGELLLTTMTVPGSVAAAHLHFMLVGQRGRASLPTRDALVADIEHAGLHVVEHQVLVPTEPFVSVRATRRRRIHRPADRDARH